MPDHGFTPEQIERLRAQNEAKHKGVNADGFYRIHRRTVRETAEKAEYVDGVRRHVASGLYAAIYPEAALIGTQRFLDEQGARDG